MKKIRIFLIPILLVMLLAGVFVSFAQEQITLTTYYPAPLGVYSNLSVANQLKMLTVAGAAITNVGPGIWLAPPVGGTNNAIQIAPYNSGGTRGLRMTYFSTGLAADVNEFGHNVGVTPFRGLRVRGDDQAFFTNDLTINRDLRVTRDVFISRHFQVQPGMKNNSCVSVNYASTGLTLCPWNTILAFPVTVIPAGPPGRMMCCAACRDQINNTSGVSVPDGLCD